MFPGVYHDGLQLGNSVPWVKGISLPFAAAMLRQINPQYLPASGTNSLREVLCFFLVPAFPVDKQINLVCFLAVQDGGDLSNLKYCLFYSVLRSCSVFVKQTIRLTSAKPTLR